MSEFARSGVKVEEALTLYRKILNVSSEIRDLEAHELFEKIYAEEEVHLFRFQEYTSIEDETEEDGISPLRMARGVH